MENSFRPYLLAWLTVERALYGVCLLMAAALRFPGLGRTPLGVGEAGAVWPAWIAATTGTAPAPATDPPTSALLFSLHWFLFWLIGATGEAVTRWPAAFMGTSLVLLPWCLRPLIGRLSALIMAALFAIDPVLVSLSRTADGASVAAFFGMLAFVTLARHGTTLSAIALGLLLASGTQAWSLLILLALVYGIQSCTEDRGVRQIGIVLLTVLLTATSGFAQWAGPPLVSVSLSAWLRAWGIAENPSTSLGILVADLVRTQPLLLALPIAALGSWWCGNRSRPQGLAPQRDVGRPRPLRSALVVLSATVLALGQADTLTGRLGLTIVLAVLAACAGGRFVTDFTGRLGDRSAKGAMLTWAVTLAIGLLVLVTIRAGVSEHRKQPEAVDGIRHLSQDVAALCAERDGAGFGCRIEVVATPWPDPVLGWYLRDVAASIRWVFSPALDDGTPARRLIVSHAEASSSIGDGRPLMLPTHYIGSEYRVGSAARRGSRIVLWVPAHEAVRTR